MSWPRKYTARKFRNVVSMGAVAEDRVDCRHAWRFLALELRSAMGEGNGRRRPETGDDDPGLLSADRHGTAAMDLWKPLRSGSCPNLPGYVYRPVTSASPEPTTASLPLECSRRRGESARAERDGFLCPRAIAMVASG